MNSTKELYNEFKRLWSQFEENHILFEEKGNKSAGARARKSVGEIKKLITDYRKMSVSESKK